MNTDYKELLRYIRYSALLFIFATSLSGYGARPVAPDEDEFDIWDPEDSVEVIAVESDTAACVTTVGGKESVAAPEPAMNPIMGRAVVSDPAAMCSFVRRHNPDFPQEIAQAYLTVGDRYGIRGDIAFCQAIIETGWFRFADGTAVKPDQNNFCGMGVTSRGQTGNCFATIEEGVTAQIQHLYAYCCKKQLPEGEAIVDPRFKLVGRGVAPHWEQLSNRWAMNPNYGSQIMKLYSQLLDWSKR